MGLDERLTVILSEHFAQELRTHGLKVVTSNEISALLGQERQKQLLGCADGASSCLAELGAALGCEGTVMVSAAQIEDVVQLDVKVLASSDARTLAQASRRVSGKKQLLEALDEVARVISDTLTDPGPAPRRRALWTGLAGGAVSLAGAGLLIGARITYDSLASALLKQGAVLKADRDTALRGTGLWISGWVGVGLGAASLVTAGVLWFLGVDAPVLPAVSLGPTGVTFGFTGALP